MRLTSLFTLALATNVVVGSSSWFSKAGTLMLICDSHLLSYYISKLTNYPAAYNKWHQNELERWLSDHDIPYPTPADRKDLEILIQKNWDTHAVAPYRDWDTEKLTAYLKQKGVETKDTAGANKDTLISQVQAKWYETEDKAQNAWEETKNWFLDTWSDSTLKSFADKHGIPGKLAASRCITYVIVLKPMNPQFLNRESAILFFSRSVLTSRLSLRSSGRLLHTLVTGCTRHGLSPT
jgi:hypothetical protein